MRNSRKCEQTVLHKLQCRTAAQDTVRYLQIKSQGLLKMRNYTPRRCGILSAVREKAGKTAKTD